MLPKKVNDTFGRKSYFQVSFIRHQNVQNPLKCRTREQFFLKWGPWSRASGFCDYSFSCSDENHKQLWSKSLYSLIFFFFLDLLACLTGLLNWRDLIQTSVTLKQVADKWSRIGGMFMNKKKTKNFMALINSRNFIASHLNNEANTWKSKSVKFVLQLTGSCLLKSLLVEGLYKSVTIPSFIFSRKVWPWECIETGSRSVHSSLQESMVCFWNELFPIPRFLAQLPWGSFSALHPAPHAERTQRQKPGAALSSGAARPGVCSWEGRMPSSSI